MRSPAEVRAPVLLIILAACGGATGPEPAGLTHEAYVWQRAWTPAVSSAVAAAPTDVTGLRVLAIEVTGSAQVWPDVDVAALARAGRPVTAVMRIDGSRLPEALTLGPLVERLDGWRRAGVDVAGIEIDHDCATPALDGYAAWLEAVRPPAPLRFSITALPTWAATPSLRRVAAAVDELVVQVHAVRAPRIFDAGAARRWLERFAAATPGATLRVALPTYRIAVGGAVAEANPAEVGGLLRSLQRSPIAGVGGVVWFRLPVAGDHAAWPPATLAAVIRGAPLAPALAVRLVARGAGQHDVVLENRGTIAAPFPALRIEGALVAADLTGGYVAVTSDHRHWAGPPRAVAAGSSAVVGWATGEGLDVSAY